MDKSKYVLFLWILLAVVTVGIFSVALIDGIKHSKPASSVTTITTDDKEAAKKTKVGYKIGDEAPGFTLSSIDNHEISLSDYRGKNVIVNFWATWCGPCRFETPFLQSVNGSFAKEGIVLLAINVKDTPQNAASYAKQNNLDFIIPIDPQGQMINDYNVHGIPTTFFIDEQGIIKDIKIGPFTSEGEIIDKIKSSFN